MQDIIEAPVLQSQAFNIYTSFCYGMSGPPNLYVVPIGELSFDVAL